MSALGGIVSLDRRFSRSARLESDLGGTVPLSGYVMQASVAKALNAMAESQSDTGQGAFTWTGPYGGGKSSAALLVASLVSGADEQREIAVRIAGPELTASFDRAFPRGEGGWRTVAVTGSRTTLRTAVAAAAASALGWAEDLSARASASDRELIDAVDPGQTAGGVLLILDELGKLLDCEAAGGGDAHLLQDLAERATRSGGRLVVIGILHQSFDQYAGRADRETRREWAKVQGRFQDIPFLTAADETVALLGRAIRTELTPAEAIARAAAVAEAVGRRRPADVATLSGLLAATWPLNPVTALLLGPVSRQRFAQNERSVFGFLSSAEPAGFQDFLATASGAETYDPARLWDYLAANFGMALASGPDGQRFSLAFEAIERSSARGGDVHVALTKAAALIEFFRNGSGLTLSDEFLAASVPGADPRTVEAAIGDLLEWAVLIRQPRLGGYALFAGSDFDLDEAITRSTTALSPEDIATVPNRAGLAAVSAKRHYFETGALRTFGIAVQLLGADDDPAAIAARISGRAGKTSGTMVLLLGDGSLSEAQIDQRAKRVAAELGKRGAVAAVGSTWRDFHIRTGAEELFAIERVLREHPQIEGDRIARREIGARLAATVQELHQLLERALETARWRLASAPDQRVEGRLPTIATALADGAFPDAPVIKSELLQRDRPSSNAMAALRALCHAMVTSPAQPALGITGFPAEMGLYLTVVSALGLHGRDAAGRLGFHAPPEEGQGATLRRAWTVLEEGSGRTFADIFDEWRRPPFGMKAGVMPVIALAYMLANRDRIALYVDDTFQTELDDLVVDRLLQRPAALRIKQIDRTIAQTAFLGGLSELLALPGTSGALPVAQALFGRIAKLPSYSKRTALGAPAPALAIRDAVMKAKDPEALLFQALPAAMGDRPSAPAVVEAVRACEGLYPALLSEVRVALARALGADPGNFYGVAARAETIKGLTNDYAFEAFCMRAAAFDGGDGDIEGLASVLVHRPAHSWSDRDREQAMVELARFGRRFRELEALATVRDRRSSTEALALVVGVDPNAPPLLSSFELTEEEKAVASAMAREVLAVLPNHGIAGRVRLAALARAVASLTADLEVA